MKAQLKPMPQSEKTSSGEAACSKPIGEVSNILMCIMILMRDTNRGVVFGGYTSLCSSLNVTPQVGVARKTHCDALCCLCNGASINGVQLDCLPEILFVRNICYC